MKTLSSNKKAFFDYEIKEKLEAGISLLGQEVKAIKSGRIDLAGSYVSLRDMEAYLINANIPPYQPNNTPPDYDPYRLRKLLLKKTEIKYLADKTRQKGLTLVPLKVYTKKGKIKIEIGIGQGKKKTDKRESIKKKEVERRIRRTLNEM